MTNKTEDLSKVNQKDQNLQSEKAQKLGQALRDNIKRRKQAVLDKNGK